jgi:hypothetical protein
MFTLGVLITAGGCVDPGRHPYAFALQVFHGAPTGVALLLTFNAPERPASRLNDLGMLLTLVAGGLNVLLMADALYRAAPGEAREGE